MEVRGLHDENSMDALFFSAHSLLAMGAIYLDVEGPNGTHQQPITQSQ
jgi:hypothetical protein